MYLVKTPELLKPLASDLVWNLSRDEKTLYITFDDGPTENITFRILDILESYGAKATFFCIGGNVLKYPAAYDGLLSAGHSVGNHTWNHMNGRDFRDYSYLRNVLECSKVVKSGLFRPPYGMIRGSQINALKNRYQIIMWDVLTADWSAKVSPEKCLKNAVDNALNGSIVVFHDSVKAGENMLYTLPRALEFWTERGFRFAALNENGNRN